MYTDCNDACSPEGLDLCISSSPAGCCDFFQSGNCQSGSCTPPRVPNADFICGKLIALLRTLIITDETSLHSIAFKACLSCPFEGCYVHGCKHNIKKIEVESCHFHVF